MIASNTLTAFVGALYLVWIVERAKKCLDFGSTVYFWHFVATCIYSGFPARLEWWVVNGCGLAVMALLGEYLCIRRELMDIPLSALRSFRGAAGSSSGRAAASSAPGSSANKEQGTEEERAPLTSIVLDRVVEMSSLASGGGQVTPTLRAERSRNSNQGSNNKSEFS